jgi:membrane-associated protein
MFYNIAGCILWVGGLILVGFFLGANWWVKENFEKIILAIGAFTLAPVLWKMLASRTGSPTIVVGREAVEEELGLNDPKSPVAR